MRTHHLALYALLVAACTPTLRDDVYACTTTSECPTGFQCIGERCRNTSGTDCPMGRDSECFDDSLCTLDTCEAGFCIHVADPDTEGTSCEDAIFCNGPNTCRSGVCEVSGAPPCEVCDEGAMGCVECGREGMACCEGGLCADGVCDGALCQPCGGLGQACCPNGFCSLGTSCDYVTTIQCVTCGGSGEPCCLDPMAGVATCNVTGEVCDFRSALPLCSVCGHSGEPACPTGCFEGVPIEGVCTVSDCPDPCGAGSVCGKDPNGPPLAPPLCLPCGFTGTYCCPGDPVCNAASGSSYDCYFGYCADDMVAPGER